MRKITCSKVRFTQPTFTYTDDYRTMSVTNVVQVRVNPKRDTISAALATGPSMIAGLPPVGLLGVAAKKALISKTDGFEKKFWVGLGVIIATAGVGFIPYLIAEGGQKPTDQVQSSRRSTASNRYRRTTSKTYARRY